MTCPQSVQVARSLTMYRDILRLRYFKHLHTAEITFGNVFVVRTCSLISLDEPVQTSVLAPKMAKISIGMHYNASSILSLGGCL